MKAKLKFKKISEKDAGKWMLSKIFLQPLDISDASKCHCFCYQDMAGSGQIASGNYVAFQSTEVLLDEWVANLLARGLRTAKNQISISMCNSQEQKLILHNLVTWE